jgi:hypothetical protein
MSNSYRTLIERLRQFADGHYIIQKFYHGQIDAADLDKEPRYPMMHVLPVDIRASEGTLDYALEIRFADIGRDKEIKTDYQKEIISDMSRLALSLISEIENGQVLFGEDAEIVDKQATIIPFIEEFTHVLTGVQLNVTIRLPYNWSACDIPADYSPNITDNPDTGSGILTKIGVYNDGAFVGYTSFLDFSDDFNVTVNGNKIEVTLVGGGGGGAGTLQETTDNGNTTTNDIELIDAAEVKFGAGGGVLLDNGSRLREGTIDANTGGSKGIAQICGVGYELKWEAGSQYVMNGNGDTIRIVNHKFNIAPAATDDSSSGFYVGSRWILDDGVSYICTDATVDAAVWEIEVSPYIPLAGTDGTNLVTGNIVIDPAVENWSISETNSGKLHEVGWEAGVLAYIRTSLGSNVGQVTVRETAVESSVTDGTSTSNVQLSPEAIQIASSNGTDSIDLEITPTTATVNVTNAPTFEGLKYNDDFSANFVLRSLIDQEVLKKRIWTKAGTPTVTDDINEAFVVGSLIWDTTNSILYKCTDNTGGAAVWSAAIAGGGDMLKSVYDTDNDGIVDSAETVQIVVRNSTGSTLTKGQVVYLSGATGNRPNAVLAQANTEASSDKTIGVVVANIANNADGQVAVSGTLHNLDTSAFTAGDAVWLSAATAGAITATAPAEPNHTVFIGYIARAHPTQGRLVIAIQNGYELDDIHGVSITTPATNDYLYYASDGLWKNRTLPSPVYLELVRTGSGIPTSSTRYAAEGLAGVNTSIVITIAPRKLFSTFRVLITTAQPASGSLTIMRKFYNIANSEIGSQSLVIAASSVAGIYEYTGATFDMSATNGSYGFTIVNAATSTSANVNSIESVYE